MIISDCYKCFDPDLPVVHGLYVIKNVKVISGAELQNANTPISTKLRE